MQEIKIDKRVRAAKMNNSGRTVMRKNENTLNTCVDRPAAYWHDYVESMPELESIIDAWRESSEE